MRRRCRTFVESLQQFPNPEVLKQAHRARGEPQRRSPRWQIQPLLFVLLTMTWCTGDSLPERFETARAFYIACHEKRKRPGKTVDGLQQCFQAASTRAEDVGRGRSSANATPVLRSLGNFRLDCVGLRRITQRMSADARVGTTIRKGEQRRAAPSIWITALVHLRTGLLWAWRSAKAQPASSSTWYNFCPPSRNEP